MEFVPQRLGIPALSVERYRGSTHHTSVEPVGARVIVRVHASPEPARQHVFHAFDRVFRSTQKHPNTVFPPVFEGLKGGLEPWLFPNSL